VPVAFAMSFSKLRAELLNKDKAAARGAAVVKEFSLNGQASRGDVVRRALQAFEFALQGFSVKVQLVDNRGKALASTDGAGSVSTSSSKGGLDEDALDRSERRGRRGGDDDGDSGDGDDDRRGGRGGGAGGGGKKGKLTKKELEMQKRKAAIAKAMSTGAPLPADEEPGAAGRSGGTNDGTETLLALNDVVMQCAGLLVQRRSDVKIRHGLAMAMMTQYLKAKGLFTPVSGPSGAKAAVVPTNEGGSPVVPSEVRSQLIAISHELRDITR